jgi:hypothetical protein
MDVSSDNQVSVTLATSESSMNFCSVEFCRIGARRSDERKQQNSNDRFHRFESLMGRGRRR